MQENQESKRGVLRQAPCYNGPSPGLGQKTWQRGATALIGASPAKHYDTQALTEQRKDKNQEGQTDKCIKGCPFDDNQKQHDIAKENCVTIKPRPGWQTGPLT